MSLQYWASSLLLFLGACKVLQALYNFYHFITFHFLTPSRPLAAYKSSTKPSWAVVTGSSAGIGLGIAKALLSQGFNLIILGHNEDEVFSVVESLCHEYPDREVRAAVMDATDDHISSMIRGFEPENLRISVLVNNVGGNPRWGLPLSRLWACDAIERTIQLNANFMAETTKSMIPLLQKQTALEDRSLILNLSSDNWQGMPYAVVYAATKAFVRSFSIGLAQDLQDEASTKHIDSLCVVPGDVWTQSNCVAVAPRSPTADEYGRMVVDHVDGAVKRGWRWMSPYWRHALEAGILERLPEWWATRAARDRMNRKAARWEEHSAKGGEEFYYNYPRPRRSCGSAYVRKMKVLGSTKKLMI